MSFVEEESATLEAALAFVDGFEGSSAACSSERSLKKRSDKRPHRLSIKEELQQLRRLVPEMEAALAGMKGRRGWGNQPATDQRSVWKQAVAHEFQLRRRAETTNRQLRRILANLLNSTRASRDAIVEPMSKEDLSVICAPQQTMAMHQRATEEATVVALLADRLQQLKLDMDRVLRRSGLVDADSWFSRKLRQVDSKLGALVETSCCFPLSCSMELTAERFCQSYHRQLMRGDDHSVSELNGHRKTYMHEYGQHSYKLDVKLSLRKYVEADRVVVMWSSVAPMTSKGVRFILDQMIVIKRVESSSTNRGMPKLNAQASGSLLQGWFRVYAERFESPANFSSDDAGIETLSDQIMDATSNYLTSYMTDFRTTLLDTSVYPPRCGS